MKTKHSSSLWGTSMPWPPITLLKIEAGVYNWSFLHASGLLYLLALPMCLGGKSITWQIICSFSCISDRQVQSICYSSEPPSPHIFIPHSEFPVKMLTDWRRQSDCFWREREREWSWWVQQAKEWAVAQRNISRNEKLWFYKKIKSWAPLWNF